MHQKFGGILQGVQMKIAETNFIPLYYISVRPNVQEIYCPAQNCRSVIRRLLANNLKLTIRHMGFILPRLQHTLIWDSYCNRHGIRGSRSTPRANSLTENALMSTWDMFRCHQSTSLVLTGTYFSPFCLRHSHHTPHRYTIGVKTGFHRS